MRGEDKNYKVQVKSTKSYGPNNWTIVTMTVFEFTTIRKGWLGEEVQERKEDHEFVLVENTWYHKATGMPLELFCLDRYTGKIDHNWLRQFLEAAHMRRLFHRLDENIAKTASVAS